MKGAEVHVGGRGRSLLAGNRASVGHSWGGNGTKTIPVSLVVVLKMKVKHSCYLQFSGYLPLKQVHFLE